MELKETLHTTGLAQKRQNEPAEDIILFESSKMKNIRGSMKPTIVFVILCLIQATVGILIERPENTVAMLNDSTTIRCKSDETDPKLQWHTFDNNLEEMELWSGYSLNPAACPYRLCKIYNPTTGEFNLNIIATKETARPYRCTEPSTLTRVTAYLVVIGNLLCNDSSTEDLVNLTCSIEFRGSWAPTMEWKEQGSDGEIFLSVEVNTIIVLNECVTSSLVMEVQRGRRNYACTTKFDISGKPVGTTAINVPEYKETWISSMFPKSQASNNIGLSVGLGVGLGVPIVIGLIVLAVVLSRRAYSGEPSSPRDMKNR